MTEEMQIRSVELMGGVTDVDSRSHQVQTKFPHEVVDSFKTTFGSHGTTPLPATWDHLASTWPADAMIPAAGRGCQTRRRRGLGGGARSGPRR